MPALKAIDDDRVIAFRLLKTIALEVDYHFWAHTHHIYIFPKKGNFDNADQTDF